MTGRTHKLSGKVLASLAFIAFNFDPLYRILQAGLATNSARVVKALHINTSWTSIVTALAMLLTLRLFSKATSVLNDLDQQPNTIPYKDNIFARLINRILLAVNQHHRSHLTHTILTSALVDATLIILGLQYFQTSPLVMIVILGFVCGTASHIIADMFNGTGVYLLPFLPITVAFVPKKVNSVKLIIIGLFLIVCSVAGLVLPVPAVFKGVSILLILIACSLIGVAVCCRGMKFTTGGQWENIFYKVVNVLDAAATTLACIICFI